MGRVVTTTFLFFCLSAVLGGCAATAPPGGGAARTNLVQLKAGQADLSAQLDRLRTNLMLVEARLHDQQQTIQKLQQALEAKKVTSGGEKAESSVVRSGLAGTPAGPTKSASSSAALYLQAFGDFTSGQFQQAIQGFESFLRLNPSSDYANNAQYWLGECYYSLQQYDRAVKELQKVVENYPRGSKVPDAMLRMAEALQKMNQSARAGQILEQLRSRYPDSPAARKSMKPTGSR